MKPQASAGEWINNIFASNNISPWRLKNGPSPASFSFIFSQFKQTSIQILQQIDVNKCQVNPVYGAGI